MGSFFERQKPPPVQKFTPAPLVSTAPEEKTPEQKKAEQDKSDSSIRAQSLLDRSRGRFGTILTGFNGFLDTKKTDTEPRKTLLGE